jgi:general stress protein 26
MKIIDATSDTPGMTREEAELFLQSKLNLQLATIDEKGEPNIQPVWFYYDKDQRKFFFTTSKLAKKAKNLRSNPVIYFSIDQENYDENVPPRGVKGKGTATVVEDPNRILPQADRISMKYLGTLDHPVAKTITEITKKGEVVLVEINPRFLSTWDYSKMQQQ